MTGNVSGFFFEKNHQNSHQQIFPIFLIQSQLAGMKNNKIIMMEYEHLEELVKDVRDLKELMKRQNRETMVPELLRTDEIKKILKLKDSSLATLRQNGTLPFTKIGGTIYYLKQDIIDSIKNNYSGTVGDLH